MKKKIRPSGTFEWASKTYDICTGCNHDCRYCYARYDAVTKYKFVPDGQWPTMTVDEKKVNKKHPKG